MRFPQVLSTQWYVALRIVNTYPALRTGSVLGLLARKPEAFPETKFKIIPATFNWCKHLYSKILISYDQSSQNKDDGSRTGPIETSEPFPETKPNFIKRTIKSGKHLYTSLISTH
ncbi:hypothetical protein Hanom_Chr11g01027461 [Helianthus anomalus]